MMRLLRELSALASRHAQALWFVVTRVVPTIFRTRRRPVYFSKFSGIGDIICTFPAALELKRRHSGAPLIYHCHPEFTCLPRLAGLTNDVTSFPNIGLVGHWYSFLLGGFYQFASDDDRPNVIPTDVYIKDFGRQFGLVVEDDHPQLKPGAAVVARIEARLAAEAPGSGPLVVIHPGPSWPVREWPRESWIAWIEAMRARGITRIVQIGSARHLAMGNVGAVSLPGVLSWVDKLTLEESVALISLADLFVGIDSGMLHIAVAVRTPAVGLWGATSAHLRFSSANARSFVTSSVECQGCHHRVPRLHWITGCPYNIKCMREIAAADVLGACLHRLEGGKA